jgi:hypothetical protein
MKRLMMTLSVLFVSFCLQAQTDLYLKIKKILQQTHPALITDSKLIAINIWSANNDNSRDANKSFEKAYNVYQVAKLKGGLRGLVVVTLNLDNLSSDAVITLGKDNITKSISLKAEAVKELEVYGIENIVFDSNGTRVYKNLSPLQIFSSIQSLITR